MLDVFLSLKIINMRWSMKNMQNKKRQKQVVPVGIEPTTFALLARRSTD